MIKGGFAIFDEHVIDTVSNRHVKPFELMLEFNVVEGGSGFDRSFKTTYNKHGYKDVLCPQSPIDDRLII